ncbi:MAG: LPS export ABC transporter periplasmic protein LptC [Bacillota bacterium]
MINKKWLMIIGVIMLLMIGYMIMGQGTTPESEVADDPPQEEKKQEDAQAELQNASLTLYSQDETTRWELKAESIEHFSDSNQIKLHQVTADVYQQEEQVTTLKAEQGVLDSKTNFLELTGAVTITSGTKVVKANHLNWNNAKNELIGSGDVLLKQQNLKITGKKFISQVDLEKLRVLENVLLRARKEDDKDD